MKNNLLLMTSLALTLIVSNVKSIKFNLPSTKSKSKSKSISFNTQNSYSDSNSSSNSSSSSSSSSSSTDEENNQSFNHDLSSSSETKGRFKNLKKDDDKISLNKKLKNKNKNISKGTNSKKRKMEYKQELDKLLKSYAGGYTNINRNENENGFIYNQDWHEKMKKTELEFTDVGLLQLNGLIESFEKETQGIIKEPLNAGWWLISFREGMSKSGTIFKFESHQSIRVSLVDLFCRGDSFSVLDGGNLIAQSSRTLPDRECLERIINPDEAIREGRWSSVVFNLESGDHEIEIKTVDSPMTGGLAAIRFDPVRLMRKVSRKNVCRGYNGLLLITAKLYKFDAEAECNKFKSDLAHVSGKEPEVLKSLKSCLGRGSSEMVWVYRKDTREIESFSLKGFFGKPGKDEDNLQFTLCRVRKDI